MKTYDPYIGITGFRNYSEVQRINKAFKQGKPKSSSHMLHVGAMMSRRTLLGKRSRFTNAFPKNSEYLSIFGNSDVYNCLHYADFDPEPDAALDEHIIQAIDYCGPNLKALQLDITWPSLTKITRIRRALPQSIEIILQVGEKAFNDVEKNIHKLAYRMEDYALVVDRFLIDMSCGRGILMNPKLTISCMDVFRARGYCHGFVAAGGLGLGSLDSISRVRRQHPDISWDAESKLRRSGNNMDRIDLNIAISYIHESLLLLM